MKNIFKRLFVCVCIFLISFTILLPPKISFAVPSVDGKAFVLMDAKSGQILASKNEDEKLPPASTTKVMTAILVLEKAKFTDTVTVQHDFGSDTGTTIGLRKGEVVTVEDLLYGMLLLSANDCAITLAEHIGGSEEGFAKLMNEKAKELGCENTNFITSSGLHKNDHYTTARDLSLILKEALRYPDFIEIAQQPNHEFKASNIDGKKHWADNKNFMIAKTNGKGEFFYKNTLAGKTGYTPEANNTIVTSAKKDDQTLIVTILNSKNNGMVDAKDLFEYGFKDFSTVKLYSAGEKIGTIDSANGPIELSSSKDIFYTVKKGEEGNINKSCNVLKTDMQASYKKGEKITDGELTVNGEKFTTIGLSSSKDISVGSSGGTSALKGKKMIIIIGVFILLALILVALFVIKKKKKNNSKKTITVDNNVAKKESTLDAIKASKKLGEDAISEIAEDLYEDHYDDYNDNYNNGYEDDYYKENSPYNQADNIKSASKDFTQNIPIMAKVKSPGRKQYTENTASIDDIMKKLQMQTKDPTPQKQQPNKKVNNYQQEPNKNINNYKQQPNNGINSYQQVNYNNAQDYNQYPNSRNNNYSSNPQMQQPNRNISNQETPIRNQSQRNSTGNQMQQSNRHIPNNNYVSPQQVVNNTAASPNNNSMRGRQNLNAQAPNNNRVNSGRSYPNNNMGNNQQYQNSNVPTPNRSRNNSVNPKARNNSNQKNNHSNNNPYWDDNRF